MAGNLRATATVAVLTVLVVAAPSAPAEADTVKASVVRTVATSRFSPPSPDPSGITYLSSKGRLLIVDAEVEEMSIYRSVNLWETSLTGSVLRTGTTTRFTREPTGAAFDARDGTLWVSDDNTFRISNVKAGSDGNFGTSDDSWTSFDARSVGDSDPEGLTVDTSNGDLYLAGGTTRAFYRVGRGGDGKFGTSDDVKGKFDVGKYGLRDMEGIAYDPARNTIVTLDVPTKRLYELSRSGSLVRIIDLSAASMRGGGDVAIAPASAGGGRTSYWVVIRGVDNDDDPNENDGKLYEFSLGESAPGNQSPGVTIAAPADGSNHAAGSPIQFTGTASDPEDGSLTSNLTWVSSIDGQIGSGGSFTAVLSSGSHTITARATDSAGATGSTAVAITVGTGGGGALPAFVAVADASLYADSPSANFGTGQTLETDGSPVKRYLLKFQVSGVSGKTVTGVRVRLSCTNSSTGKGGDFRPTTTSGWIESGSGGVTWSTQPGFDAAAPPLASLGPVSAGSVYSVTLPASYITGDGTYSLVVTSTSSDGADYWSREKGGSLAPQLFVTVS
jgi:hypothetical protein